MIRDRILQLEQTLERLFGGRPPREPIEIRRAVLESLLAQVRSVGRGRKILPFSRATIHVIAADATERRVLKDALGPEELTAELRRELERGSVEIPSGLTVQLRLVREPGKTWASGARFHVTVSQPDDADPVVPGTPMPGTAVPGSRNQSFPSGVEESTAPAAGSVTAVLRVVEGEARPRTLTSEAARINIGRQVDVVDRSGRPVRHNDVAFVGEDEVSRSVSRAHAHVRFDRSTRTHRIFDENSAYGTEVEREGRRIVVPAGRDGLKLRPGDHIRVGRASLRFDVR